jgi:hypothetical protein
MGLEEAVSGEWRGLRWVSRCHAAVGKGGGHGLWWVGKGGRGCNTLNLGYKIYFLISTKFRCYSLISSISFIFFLKMEN